MAKSLIIIAEDDVALAKAIAMALAKEKVESVFAKDGNETIKAIEERKPDLLILDLIMPEKNGVEVLEYLKEKKAKFPVVVLTNIDDEKKRKLCMKLGACDYIIKSTLSLEDIPKMILDHL